MSDTFSRFKRVVTGHGSDGRSTVTLQAPPWDPAPGMGFGEIWGTDAAAPIFSRAGDAAKDRLVLEPPPGGTRFRYFVVAPEDPSVSPEQMRAILDVGFEALGSAHCRPDTSRHPGMHQTSTIDYVTVLSGAVVLVLDEGEVELQPFDTVVQRGTNHAWINRECEPALLVAVIVDARSG